MVFKLNVNLFIPITKWLTGIFITPSDLVNVLVHSPYTEGSSLWLEDVRKLIILLQNFQYFININKWENITTFIHL